MSIYVDLAREARITEMEDEIDRQQKEITQLNSRLANAIALVETLEADIYNLARELEPNGARNDLP